MLRLSNETQTITYPSDAHNAAVFAPEIPTQPRGRVDHKVA